MSGNLRAALLAITSTLAVALPLPAQDTNAPGRRARVFEYRYEYNTASSNENHYIILDSIAGRLRGWYYGTSDEFDSAREGYLPGFFVAEMQELAIGAGRVTYSLAKPAQLFTSAVPLRYRNAAEIPEGMLKPWTIPLVLNARSYSGELAGSRIVLELDKRERVFQEVQQRR